MLINCGLGAVEVGQEEESLLPQAETLVEHATIILLVLLAVFTMLSWA